jgi:hypothetical protein
MNKPFQLLHQLKFIRKLSHKHSNIKAIKPTIQMSALQVNQDIKYDMIISNLENIKKKIEYNTYFNFIIGCLTIGIYVKVIFVPFFN